MPTPIYALPDTGPTPASTPTPADNGGWVDSVWAQIANGINTVPTWTWVGALTLTTLATVLCLPAARLLTRKAGARRGKPLSDEDRKDRRLLIAALVPAALFWIAVLIGSARGLIAFGRDDLHWTGGWEWLVPATLDGVAISFTLLAFRAVRKGLNPDRALRIAFLAMLASAGINFLHEVGGSKLGAIYLAVLSLLGAFIVDELLAQFEQGADNVPRRNPKFGLRWLTWPTNTLCAWVAWRNHPPAETLKATIGNAVAHLEQVRVGKAQKRAARIDNPAWWMRFAPWTHITVLRTALAAERRTAAADIDTSNATVADLTSRLDAQAAEMDALRTQLASQKALTAEYAEKVRSEFTPSQPATQQARTGGYPPANSTEFAPANPAENRPGKGAANLSRPAPKPTHPLADDPNESIRRLARAYSRKPGGTNSDLAKLAKVSDGTANRYLPKVRAAFAAAENDGGSQMRITLPRTELPIAQPDAPVTTPVNGHHHTPEES